MKNYTLFIIFTLLSFSSMAQREIYPEESPTFFDRVYTGGNFSMGFGNYTYIDVSPLAGYMISSRMSAGLGLSYRYIKDKYYDYERNIFGWRTFVRYNVTQQLFLHGEYENLKDKFTRDDGFGNVYDYSEWISSVFVGGGIYQPFGGGRGGFMASALYNLSYRQDQSIYSSPWVFRVGFTF